MKGFIAFLFIYSTVFSGVNCTPERTKVMDGNQGLLRIFGDCRGHKSFIRKCNCDKGHALSKMEGSEKYKVKQKKHFASKIIVQNMTDAIAPVLILAKTINFNDQIKSGVFKCSLRKANICTKNASSIFGWMKLGKNPSKENIFAALEKQLQGSSKLDGEDESKSCFTYQSLQGAKC